MFADNFIKARQVDPDSNQECHSPDQDPVCRIAD